MKTSDLGLTEIMDHEGIVLQPYLDSEGVWTVYIGHTAAAGSPDPRVGAQGTMEDAIAVFRRDIAKFEREVGAAITVPLAQHEFDAAVSFHYNTGAIGRATWVETLNSGDRARAADQIMNWSKPKAIISRRRAEQRLFRDGTYSSDGKVPVYEAVNGRVQWGNVRLVDVRTLLGASPPSQPTEAATADELKALRSLRDELRRLVMDHGETLKEKR